MNSPALVQQINQLLDAPGLAQLGPETRPNTQLRREIEKLLRSSPEFTQSAARTQDLILGTLLLWHDHLNAVHEIAQGIEDTDGSLLHAIMHRREPDAGNAKYWFRRVGAHPCFLVLGRKVSAMAAGQDGRLLQKLISSGRWDTFAFVDACEEARSKRSSEADREFLRRVQRAETDAYLEHLCATT